MGKKWGTKEDQRKSQPTSSLTALRLPFAIISRGPWASEQTVSVRNRTSKRELAPLSTGGPTQRSGEPFPTAWVRGGHLGPRGPVSMGRLGSCLSRHRQREAGGPRAPAAPGFLRRRREAAVAGSARDGARQGLGGARPRPPRARRRPGGGARAAGRGASCARRGGGAGRAAWSPPEALRLFSRPGPRAALLPRLGFPAPCPPSARPFLLPPPPRPRKALLQQPGSMAAVETRVCETDGCSSEAKLQCPTCIKLGIQGSYFCSQVDARSPAPPPADPLPSPPALAAGRDAPPLPRAGSRPRFFRPPPQPAAPSRLRGPRAPGDRTRRGARGAGALSAGP